MSKFAVPARLEKAANELIGNTRITAGCSHEMVQVMSLARTQKLLRKRADVDCGMVDSQYLDGEFKLATCYCLPDDCEIVVQDEKPQVPQWIKDRYTVCEIKPYASLSTQYKVNYPDGNWQTSAGLPAALRCDGWVFKGWLHEHLDYAICLPLVFKDVNCLDYDEQNWTTMNKANRPVESSTAYASVWQKAGK